MAYTTLERTLHALGDEGKIDSFFVSARPRLLVAKARYSALAGLLRCVVEDPWTLNGMEDEKKEKRLPCP